MLDLTLEHGRVLVDGSSELCLEVPAGVRVGGADTRADSSADTTERIREVEGR